MDIEQDLLDKFEEIFESVPQIVQCNSFNQLTKL